MTILIVDAVFSDEYKNQTMKNTVAFGISRTSLFFGKLIAELIVAVISLIVLLAVLILSTLILMGPGDQTCSRRRRFLSFSKGSCYACRCL